tara:strand:- start:2332 stop:2451 length:120 start_codon:yes stop_codon:yes gene_type:complete
MNPHTRGVVQCAEPAAQDRLEFDAAFRGNVEISYCTSDN